MTAIRSFFAVPLSVQSEQQLAEACDGLWAAVERGMNPEATIRWIPPQNYHLTLAFLGNIQRRDLSLLHDIAQQVVADSVEERFELCRFEWFPSAVKPRLLVAVPAECPPLLRLQRELSRRLGGQGFHLEKRAFRPHISLARVRELSSPIDLENEPLGIDCELDELVLFSSTQGRGGSVYTPLFVEPLGFAR